MASASGACPLDQKQLIDLYFIEHRTKILDIAAFLDRLDRAREHNAERDFRLLALREALKALIREETSRVYAIQMLLSDPTTEPLEALDQKSANGAYDPRGKLRTGQEA